MNKVLTFKQLENLRERHPGKNLVHCHGVFDLLHYGHLLHLKSASRFGDLLIVTITPDRFVNKGPGRPKYTADQRAAMLAALDVVDFVAINNFPTAVEVIKALKPHFYVKGPDYRDPHQDVTGKIKDETDAVHEVGGEIVFTTDDTMSSTSLINSHFNTWSDDQQVAIDKVRAVGGAEYALDVIDRFKGIKVLVVGEPIVDTYVFCSVAGVSSKSPTVSARRISEENYAGGSMAIANHLGSLGCDVTLSYTHNAESYYHDALRFMHRNVKVDGMLIEGIPTPRKTRYLVQSPPQRLFETIDLRSDQWNHHDARPFCERLHQQAQKADVVIVADYGHGLFELSVLEALKGIRTFTALNVQTNSGNFGFNLYSKHTRYDYLSIDERECRLATQDRFSTTGNLAARMIRESVRRTASVTLGTAGSLYFDSELTPNSCPVFFKDVVDTVGAGDAYFAITSLLVYLKTNPCLVPFLGNCYAGLKSRIVGNKAAVDVVDLIKTVQSILKV